MTHILDVGRIMMTGIRNTVNNEQGWLYEYILQESMDTDTALMESGKRRVRMVDERGTWENESNKYQTLEYGYRRQDIIFPTQSLVSDPPSDPCTNKD